MDIKQSRIWISVAVVLILIIIGVLIIKANKIEAPTTEQETEQQEIFEKTVDVKHQYKDGKHIFAGVVQIPTPCHQLSAAITPGDIAELNFEIVDSGGICAQVITDANFYVEYEGKEDQLFVGKLNGEPVNLNKFEVDADLDINAVNIFNKG
ncbi:MAG: hypothetical protein WC087_00050 [Candidatus Paceibacterota bacterium]